MAPDAPRCRDCDAPVMFVESEATGNAMCLDPYPQHGGNVLLRRAADGVVARVLNRLDAIQQARAHPLYKAHQATCSARQPPPQDHHRIEQLTLGGDA
jgi:hypothetical protein